MLIPQQYIDDALARTDIVNLIDGRVRLKKTGKNYSACCPFHDEKSPSFTVSDEKQMFYCFGCGAGGDAIKFLTEYDRLSFRDAALMVGRLAGLQDPDETQTSQQVTDAIRGQEYKKLKAQRLDAKLYFELSGEVKYRDDYTRIDGLIQRKYADFVGAEKRQIMEQMQRDEKMEAVAHSLKTSGKLPPKIQTDEKRAQLAEQRITKIQDMINESK
jgi:DNA primase catalytic core